MKSRQIRLDDLTGRVVRDQDGRSIGRLFEVRAEERGDEMVIVEYHIGPNAWLERVGFALRRFAGADTGRHIRKLAWDRVDLSDPDHPTVRDET
jgi:hypothetical protein